ncbi:MAG: peptide chain release factor N(5)-glutamine methyltransferase [Treponema sp.]|jgi:release factor glutamine methyltransferase|nr:peptide chain release factor N(5)-glutamine methyltransferase [Treponema sp.]
MTIREALAGGSAALAAAGIENPGLDASLLLAEVFNISRSSLMAAATEPLTETSNAAFDSLIKRRLAGECTAYILGKKEFYGLDFQVNSSVLVPRPDTEILVEAALKQLKIGSGKSGRILDCMRSVHTKGMCAEANTLPKQESVLKGRILDLCTGCGAAAIALKHEMPDLEVWAADISAEALEVAAANATRLLTTGEIHFCLGNLFDALPSSPFTLILSNPPYIPSAEIAGLSPEVRGEPILALDGGSDGLDIISNIISRAPEFLCPGGILLLEADPRQMEQIGSLLSQARFTNIQTHRDLSGKERVIEGKKPC